MTNNEFFERTSMNSINRLEVIDKTGRAYTHYFSGNEKVRYSLFEIVEIELLVLEVP